MPKRVLRVAAPALGLVLLSMTLLAQEAPVLGDRSTPLRPLAGEGNIGISNAVLRDQPDVRVLRVVVEPGGARAMHAHTDVKFHLFTPISGAMELRLEHDTIEVQPWHPYYMAAGTQHGFHNPGPEPVEVMETFIR
jgi:mannose-6-phosphate isomerase-like protein (cupin superfamily)